MSISYVHGHDAAEHLRLRDQATTLAELLHGDTRYPPASRVLEAGCGTGAQTLSLARNSPGALFTSIDISAPSLADARRRVADAGFDNVRFGQADILDPPFAAGSFDHVFVCFVLEHLAEPVVALRRLAAMLRPGGTITVIEGDHGSALFHPDSAAARRAIQAQVELQRRLGGNALIGRELHPLLRHAGYGSIEVSPRVVLADDSRPELADGFTRRTFTAMIEGVRAPAIDAELIEAERFDAGIRDLYRTAEADGVFCYTFFKARATKI